MATQARGLIVLLTCRTDPSPRRKLAPPGCRLEKSSTWATGLLGVCGGCWSCMVAKS